MSKPTVLITGCAGFIGSHITDEFLSSGYRVVGLDLLTYAGKESNLKDAQKFGDCFTFVKGSINDRKLLLELIKSYNIEWIINLAAETHVDNSIRSSDVFVDTNIIGVKTLLDVCRENDAILFHFSTDEVYGVSSSGAGYHAVYDETASLSPRNPYSATKAAADHLILSYNNTYGSKYIIVRPSNNFGTRQHSEKFIPTILNSINSGKKIPLYGQGTQIREWTSVKETAKAVRFIFEKSPINEVYNISSCSHYTNNDVVNTICSVLGLNPKEHIEYVKDRPGHDFRYSISSSKLEKLGYYITRDFLSDIKEVIQNDFSGLWNKTRVDQIKDSYSVSQKG